MTEETSKLSEADLEAIKNVIAKRDLIMQNILDVKKRELFELTEKLREKHKLDERRKAKAIIKRKAAKAARKANRRK